MSIANNPIFHDAKAAREWLEAQLWPDGPVCPHCGWSAQPIVCAARTSSGPLQVQGLP